MYGVRSRRPCAVPPLCPHSAPEGPRSRAPEGPRGRPAPDRSTPDRPPWPGYACPVSKRVMRPSSATVNSQRVRISPQVSLR